MAESVTEPERFVAIFDRHGVAVHGYLTRRGGTQVADELIGDVWLRAFQSRHTYDTSWPDARPWLYGIARNTLKNHWRRRREGGPAPLEPAHDPWPEVDAHLDAASRLGALRAALASLHEQDREVLLLFAWEQLSPTEIATSLGVPAGTVRWRLHRARSMLQRSAIDDRIPATEET
ncbi:MAG TPA: sigma-70 family RNA polymerase sigma factor [Acidimicrobiales bacterium]|jgi:RNA polymerase sigma-70 factor (ECF subfamily)